MIATDPHPEELLDGLARRRLSVSARERLAAHVHRCAVCRFEALVREDFALELEEPPGSGVRAVARIA